MKRYLCIFLSTALLLISTQAQAFWGLLIDPYPMPDFVDEAASFTQSAADLANNAQKTIKTAEDNLNNLKAAVLSAYKGELSSLIDNRTINPGQKQMEACEYLGKEYSNESADNVYDLVKILFLQYPSRKTLEKQRYDDYKEEFYKDTVIEIFTAAGELQEDLDNRIQPSINESIECIRGNISSCGTPAPDGNNDAIFVEGKAFEAIDNLYETLLKVTALKAQFIAAKAIYKTKALPYIEGVNGQTADTSTAGTQDENSANQNLSQNTEIFSTFPSRIYSQFSTHSTEELAFAQIGMSQSERSSISALTQVESATMLSNNKPQQYVDGALTFVVPDASPEAHAYVYEEDKMAELDKITPIDEMVSKAREVHNLIHGLSDYKNAAESVQEMRKKYEKALISLEKADRCAENYIGRHFNTASSVWGRTGNVTDYDSRKGISGWAYKAYEAAKAAETTESSSGNIIVMNIDEDNVDLSDPTATEDNLSVIESQGSVSPGKSKEEKASAEARASRMLSWQIGAEASKMLASEALKWGDPLENPPFPIWQDVKSFYNQYLDLKYENIKNYLKTYTKNDVLAVAAERLRGEDAVVDDTLRRKEALAIEEQLSAEMQKANESGEQTLSEYESNYEERLVTLQAQRKDLVAKLDNVSEQLKQDSDSLSDLRTEVKATAAEDMRGEVTAKENFPSTIEEDPSGNMTVAGVKDYDELSLAFNQKTEENKAVSEIESLENKIGKEKEDIESLEKEIENLDEKIKIYRLGAQKGVQGLKGSAEKSKQSLIENAAKLLAQADSDYGKDVKSNIMDILQDYPLKKEIGLIITPETVYEGLEESAEEALNMLYAQVDERVDLARKQLADMGENLYNPDYHNQVEKIHKGMIQDIKTMAISISATGISPIQGIELYGKLLTVDTQAEEEDYFVGRPAKARDMRAPKAVFAESLPPLREVFHFDETDFQNVKPFVEGNTQSTTILNKDFLNIGGEIPQVWQYMLRPHAYVEADMNLKEALEEGCPQISFFRGGTMPCRVKASGIVIDMDEQGNYIRTTISGDLPECSYLEERSGSIYHTRREINVALGSGEKATDKDCSYSELGTLFEADEEGNLQFRQPTYDAYYSLLKEINNMDRELGSDEKRKLAGYDRTPLAFNQIGEFLVYAENERTQKEQLNEAESQYDNMKEELFSILREYDYNPSPDLDLSQERDYNQIREELNNIKNTSIMEALNQIEEIDIVENEVVSERIAKLREIITALQKDKEEQTIIGNEIEDQNNLDEEIKTSKVNEEAANRFTESHTKASASIDLPEDPYCAIY